MALGGRLSRHMSHRAALLASLPLVALLLMATLLAHSMAQFALAYSALGIALGVTDLFMNAEGAAIEVDLGRPVFTTFHGSVSSGLMVMALLASLLATAIGPWAPGLVAAALLGVAWIMVARNLTPRALTTAGRSGGGHSQRLPLVLLGLVAGLSIAAETTAILWSAKLLDAQAPQLAAIAGLGAAFFGLCNAAVRFLGDGLRARFGDLPPMFVSILVALAGFLALGLSPGFAASVAGFAAVGFGTAVLVPCAFNLSAQISAHNRAGGIAFVSLTAGAPRILAPWLFGSMVAATSLSFAFGLFAAVMALALLLVAWLAKLR
jgi:MFS family permease